MSPRKSYDVSPDAACSDDPSLQPADGPPPRWHLEEFVRDQPLTALAIAVTAGFILGGGADTRVGRAAVGYVDGVVVRGAVGNLLVGMLMGSNERGAKDSRES